MYCGTTDGGIALHVLHDNIVTPKMHFISEYPTTPATRHSGGVSAVITDADVTGKRYIASICHIISLTEFRKPLT